MDSLRLACNNIIRRTNRYTFDDHKIAICLHTWFLGRYVKRTCREHSPIIASRIIEFLWPGISTPCERKSREDPHLGNAISWCTRPIKQISLTAELRRRVHGDRLNKDVKLVLGGYHAISSVLWLRTWREREKKRRRKKKKASRDSGTRGNWLRRGWCIPWDEHDICTRGVLRVPRIHN